MPTTRTNHGNSIQLIAPAPVKLPKYPPIPEGFDQWIYRGVKYASPRAIMVTSFDETEDERWDPPAMFQTKGHDHTHYLEAVIYHHEICECAECVLADANEADGKQYPL